MNSIQQKNVYYDFRPENEIPYRSGRDIALNSNPVDQIDVAQMDSIQINNALVQLQDNDEYVKRHISGIKFQDGSPKMYSDDEIAGLSDGSKIMGGKGSEELAIYQKNVKPLQETLNVVAPGLDVLCMRNSGNTLYVGTSDGMYTTWDGTNYNGPFLPYEEEDDDSGPQITDVVIGQS